MSDPAELSDKIRSIRKSRGYSQEELARQLGVSFPTVNAWERGKSTPYPRHQRAIEELFDAIRAEEGTFTILIVEDDPATGTILADYAAMALPDYTSAIVENGYDAILRIGLMRPRIVLLDIMMPGIDGLEVFKRIQEMKELTATRVIFVSAADESVLTRARQSGAFAVLAKPITRDQIIPALHAAALQEI